VICEGNTLTRLRNSGLVRSGEVQIRMYSSSDSSDGGSNRVVGSSANADTGLKGSSEFSDASKEVVFDGDDPTERESMGVSKKGSLGALARFDCIVWRDFRSGRNGED